MNIYRYEFVAKCPVNEKPIAYKLVIQSTTTIYVEDIVNEVNRHAKIFHEELADKLHLSFGGVQIMVAHHHGVDIETRRGLH